MRITATILCAVLSVLAFHAANGSGQQPIPATPCFERADSLDVRGVEIFDRIVYVPVSINGFGPYPFVLDTGAGELSALDEGTARSIGLRSTIVGEGGGAGEEIVQFGLADSTTIAMHGLSFANRPILTMPVRRLDAQWGKRKDGMVGGDLLSTFVTRIDYERERVVFHDAVAYEYTGPGERIPVEMWGNYIIVRSEVLLYGSEKPLEAMFFLDTGVRLSVFNSPYAKKHALAAQSPRTLTGVTGFGIGGASRGIVGRVRGIRIGSFVFKEPVMSFSAGTSGALADTSIAGIIGADFLSRFTVVLDYRRSQIFLEKNSGFDSPSEFDMCGIRFVMEGERFDLFKVFLVYEGTPAALAGVAEGDVVTAIDGRAAGSSTRESIRDYMQREGEQVRLTIEREGVTKEVTIRLKKMI
ncbi:MAG: aspartyl protease family protein [Candidatus Krumholzibacteriia bacterium]